MRVLNSPTRTLLRWRTRDRGQGASTRPPPDPGSSGQSKPPSADSIISVEELSIVTPEQHEGPTHCRVINQEPDDADLLARRQGTSSRTLPTARSGSRTLGRSGSKTLERSGSRTKTRPARALFSAPTGGLRTRQERLGQSWSRTVWHEGVPKSSSLRTKSSSEKPYSRGSPY